VRHAPLRWPRDDYNLIGNGLLALLTHPQELDRLRADPSLIESAVEELLRFDSPTQATFRSVAEDFVLRGQVGHPYEAGDSLLGSQCCGVFVLDGAVKRTLYRCGDALVLQLSKPGLRFFDRAGTIERKEHLVQFDSDLCSGDERGVRERNRIGLSERFHQTDDALNLDAGLAG
jgi:hypothetical protein